MKKLRLLKPSVAQDISLKPKRHYYKSSSFKMAALFTLLLGVCAILLGYSLYDFSKQNFIRETEAAIDIEIEHILAISTDHAAQSVTSYISKRSTLDQYPIYLYQDKDDYILAGNIDAIPKNVSRIKEGVISFHTVIALEKRLVAGKIHTFKDGSSLLVARDITDIMRIYERLKFISIMIMIFMLIVVLISFFISTFVVTRINKIADTAIDIMHTGDLSRRIHIDSQWDDLSYLATVFNNLLAKMENLMQGISDVSDHIAHDLRTPISRLRSHLEALKKKKPSEEDIDQLILETDSILSIFNALLRIAHIEKSKQQNSFTQLDVTQLLDDVVEFYEPLANEKHIRISKELQPFSIMGDRDLLFQMFTNLLDNAIKFSPANTQMNIILDAQKLVISDQGMGISNDDMAHVFDRFYRSDKSRHTPGSGLGLSMVKAVADLHHINITLKHNNPGLKVILSFH